MSSVGVWVRRAPRRKQGATFGGYRSRPLLATRHSVRHPLALGAYRLSPRSHFDVSHAEGAAVTLGSSQAPRDPRARYRRDGATSVEDVSETSDNLSAPAVLAGFDTLVKRAFARPVVRGR